MHIEFHLDKPKDTRIAPTRVYSVCKPAGTTKTQISHAWPYVSHIYKQELQFTMLGLGFPNSLHDFGLLIRLRGVVFVQTLWLNISLASWWSKPGKAHRNTALAAFPTPRMPPRGVRARVAQPLWGCTVQSQCVLSQEVPWSKSLASMVFHTA